MFIDNNFEIHIILNINKLNLYKFCYIKFNTFILLFYYILNGDWGLGVGGWGPSPNPQPPTPNPQPPPPTPPFIFFLKNYIFIKQKYIFK